VKSDNPLIDWRPAAGVPIPGRPGWTIERKLGEGGFGDVWLAYHKMTKRRRVFKFCYDVKLLRSLKHEFTISRVIQTLGKRDDIGIIQEIRLDEPPYFLESEWSTEGNIILWIEKSGGIGTVPLETRIQLVIDVAHALAAAHSVGVLHKDIKPGNILMNIMDGHPRPQLVDFGIGAVDPDALARLTISQMSQASASSSGPSGTQLYMPPECLGGGEWTTQGDIYSLGVVLYQLVVGDSPTALWHHRAPGHGWGRDIADELLREDIELCLDVDPTRRPNSAGELAGRLARLPERRREIEERKRAIAEEKKAEENEKKLRRMKLAFLERVMHFNGRPIRA
jgi:serine/threonine-protein kinase